VSTFFKIFSCLVAAIVLALSACGLFEHPEERVVITVGTQHITVKELKRDLRRVALDTEVMAEGQEHPMETLVQKMTDYYLILGYGKQQGINVSDDELEAAVKDIKKEYSEKDFSDTLVQGYIDFEEWKESFRSQLLVKKIMEKVLAGVQPVSFDEVRKYYEDNPDEFSHPGMVRFRQIITHTRAEAESILSRIRSGEDLEQLVQKYGPPGVPGAAEGVWIGKGDLEDSMEKVLFSLPVGKISEVVETPYGFHIFQVMERKPEGLKSLPEAMKEIEAKLFYAKEDAFYNNWLKNLRESTPVKINHKILQSMELG
jgi:parvulin-like peptidyl-prolyl isomerase